MQGVPNESFIMSEKSMRDVDEVLATYQYDPTQLVRILLDVQDKIEDHYIPQPVAFYIAEKLPTKISTIYNCLQFYSNLSSKPRAKFIVQVCRSIVCRANQANLLLDTVQNILGVRVGEATKDGRFIIEKVMCIGACDQAPAMRINGKIFGNLDTVEKIQAVFKDYMQE